MKKVILLIICFQVLLLSACGSSGPGQEAVPDYEVSVERVDKSVLTEDGKTLAYIYFDKPVVLGDSDACSKINTFFEQASGEWFGDNANSERPTANALFLENITPLDGFLKLVDYYRENFGDAYLLQPAYSLKHIFHSKVTLSDEETLSIMHISDWYAGGGRYFRIYGSTFDMKTGEPVPCPFADDFAFKEKLAAACPENSSWEITDKYYRDRDYIYVIAQGRDDYIIKWNGKTDEAFAAEWIEWGFLTELPE